MNKYKYNNDLINNCLYNFNKYNLSHFNKISSIDSKFDTLNNFYKDFKILKVKKSQNNKIKHKKITVLRNASLLYRA